MLEETKYHGASKHPDKTNAQATTKDGRPGAPVCKVHQDQCKQQELSEALSFTAAINLASLAHQLL